MAALRRLRETTLTRKRYIDSDLFSLLTKYSSYAKALDYKQCYKILGIREDSDQAEIRRAYLDLVKKYHPDSGTTEADAHKFSEVDKAFKTLLHKKTQERWDVEPVTEQDITHTAPQHRQYLNFDGIGVGTPFQREKQYSKFRARQAVSSVLEHRKSQSLATEGAVLHKAPVEHKIKTKYGFERVVEDLIQESMSKGEFKNLAGSGKPLKSHQKQNPYVDFITHKLNEVLINNGFTPEWITLQKEIRDEIAAFRGSLSMQRSRLGPYPLTDSRPWDDILLKYQASIASINKKIDGFNLVVPILDKQMMHVVLEKEANKILRDGEHSKCVGSTSKKNSALSEPESIFSLFESIFRK